MCIKNSINDSSLHLYNINKQTSQVEMIDKIKSFQKLVDYYSFHI